MGRQLDGGLPSVGPRRVRQKRAPAVLRPAVASERRPDIERPMDERILRRNGTFARRRRGVRKAARTRAKSENQDRTTLKVLTLFREIPKCVARVFP